jgi:endogenous inhibitor of DNA gyrase (YacG/DUF329 family)
MKCPICKQEVTDMKYRPFCSKRCADVDLGNWMIEKYVVPGQETAVDEITDNVTADEN